MSYRVHEEKPHVQSRTIQETATPMHFYIQEGSKGHFAIPCWYVETKPPDKAHFHNREKHDHYGWPGPDHPDHICQHYHYHWHTHDNCGVCGLGHKRCHRQCKDYLDMRKVFPIHLRDEGYDDKVEVRFAPLRKWDDTGLKITSHIDIQDDWVVRVIVDSTACDTKGRRRDVSVALYAHRGDHVDPVTVALLTIIPAHPGVFEED